MNREFSDLIEVKSNCRNLTELRMIGCPDENQKHNSTQKNRFFNDSSRLASGVLFASFEMRIYPRYFNR